MPKARDLREILSRPALSIAVGAHDAISAKLIEAAGFPLVWASSFTVSAAQRAMADANLLTMTENLEVARHMNDAVSIPVIADCDNGYGNAINVIRTVEEYEKVGIAGISIEDNIFPKRCSLYPGIRRELATVEEHAGKIRAAKRTQRDPDFVVIARTEALIAGWGMDEALTRARAYADAGADAILIHSKAPTAEEVLTFARLWDRPTRLVVVPTLYPDVRMEELEAAGVKLAIFANQVLRAAIKGMEGVLDILHRERHLAAVTSQIVPLEEVYRHVGVDELKASEAEFLPTKTETVRAIIIAAGFEKQLLPLIEDRPKCLLDIKGKSILERQLETLGAAGVHDVVVIRGYQKQTLTLLGPRYYDNDRYDETGEVASLFVAEPELQGRVLFLYSDILFDQSVLEKLLRSQSESAIIVDRAWIDQKERLLPLAKPMDLVVTENPPRVRHRFLPSDEEDRLLKIGQRVHPDEATGEFIGMALFSEAGTARLREVYHTLKERVNQPVHEADRLERAAMTDMLQELINHGHTVSCINIYKGWLEIDTFDDYQRAWAEIRT